MSTEENMVCPVCGHDRMYLAGSPYPERRPAGARSRSPLFVTLIPWLGRCGHRWETCYAQHSTGKVAVSVRTLPETPETFRERRQTIREYTRARRP